MEEVLPPTSSAALVNDVGIGMMTTFLLNMWQKGRSRQLKLLPYLSVHKRRRCGADDLEVDTWSSVADVATAHHLHLLLRLSCRTAALARWGWSC